LDGDTAVSGAAVGAASYAAGPCSVLIAGFVGECGWTASRCTSYVCKSVQRMKPARTEYRQLMAATQKEVRTPPQRHLAERKQVSLHK